MNLDPILDYGYTEREAAFLGLVAVHSGHFAASQYCRFTNVARGKAQKNFVAKALGKGHVREFACERYGSAHNRRSYHLYARGFYKRLGIPNSNNRRDQSRTIVNLRMAALDFVIDHPTLDYLATDRDKIAFFRGLGVPLEVLPSRTFFASPGTPATQTYFVDKFPIGVERETGRLVFTYVHDLAVPTAFFETHIRHYLPLWHALDRPWTLMFVSPSAGGREAAERAFHARVASGRVLDDHLLRYFHLQHAYLFEECRGLTKRDFDDHLELARTYGTPYYERLFQRWCDGKLADELSPKRSQETASFATYDPPTVDKFLVTIPQE